MVKITTNEILVFISCLVTIDILFRIIAFYKADKLYKERFIQNPLIKNIINNIPFMVCFTNTKGKILFANNEFKKVFPTNINTDSIYIETKLGVNDNKDVIKNRVCTITERQLLSNKTKQWFKIIRIPVLNYNQKIRVIIEIYTNIQEEIDLQERKNIFIATLTHDLKSPTLSQIKGLELLLNNSIGKVNDVQRNIINQLKNSCTYMSDLIFTILDTFTYENGQIMYNPKEFNITDLINETIYENTPLLNEKHLTVNIDSRIKSENIIADRFQIKRVIANLISNAITYGYKDSFIEINISENDNNMIIDIKNQSQYIPQEKIKDIFEKFKTTSNAKFRKTGIGLGLYLSKQIIEAHKGSIYASSEPNGICTFGFSLPITKNPVKIYQ